MKYLFISIILFMTFNLKGQDSIPKKHLLQLSLLTGAVAFNAIGDGLNSKLHYANGHVFNALSIGSLLAIPLFTNISKHDRLKFAISYLLIRYSLFDLLYNKAAKDPMNYLGGQNYYDETLRKIPQPVIYGSKIFSFGLVIYLNTKK